MNLFKDVLHYVILTLLMYLTFLVTNEVTLLYRLIVVLGVLVIADKILHKILNLR
jgi:hypothetical protein